MEKLLQLPDCPSVQYDDNPFSGTPRLDGASNSRASTMPTKDASRVTSLLAGQVESLACKTLAGKVVLSQKLIKQTEIFQNKLNGQKEEVAATVPRLKFRDLDWRTKPYLRLADECYEFVSRFDQMAGLNFARNLTNASENWRNGRPDYTFRNVVDMALGGTNLVYHYYHNGLSSILFQGREKHLLPGLYLENANRRVQMDVVTGSNVNIASSDPRVSLDDFIKLVGRGSWSAFNVKALTAMGIDGPKALSRIRTCDFSQLQSQIGKIIMSSETEKPFMPSRAGLIYITASGVKVHSYRLDNDFLVAWARGLHQRINTKRQDGTMDNEEFIQTSILYRKLLAQLR